MTVKRLLTKRAEIGRRLRSLGVRRTKVYLCATAEPRIGLDFELRAKRTEAHFRHLDAIGRYLRTLRLKKLRVHASGVEFDAGLRFRGEREVEMAFEIVRTFKRFFFFWAVVEPFRIIETEKERATLTRRLKYRDIRRDERRIIVDGLESGSPGVTISNALDALFRRGSDRQRAALLEILERSGQ